MVLNYYKNALYFVGSDNVHGHEIWKTNGTPAGTKRVTSLCPGNRPYLTEYPKILGAHSDGLYFVSPDCPFGERTLWLTKGTPGSTHTVLRGTGVSLPRFSTKGELLSVAPYLLLRADRPGRGEELFVLAGEDPNRGLGITSAIYLLLMSD